MNRRLVVVRHAKAEAEPADDDPARPLARRGLADAALVGQALAQRVPRPDGIVTSPAARARDTAGLIAASWSPPLLPWVDARLYGFGSEGLRAVVAALPSTARVVVLVGHNPSIEDAVCSWTGHALHMRTAAVACLACEGSWEVVAERSDWRLDDGFGPKDLAG